MEIYYFSTATLYRGPAALLPGLAHDSGVWNVLLLHYGGGAGDAEKNENGKNAFIYKVAMPPQGTRRKTKKEKINLDIEKGKDGKKVKDKKVFYERKDGNGGKGFLYKVAAPLAVPPLRLGGEINLCGRRGLRGGFWVFGGVLSGCLVLFSSRRFMFFGAENIYSANTWLRNTLTGNNLPANIIRQTGYVLSIRDSGTCRISEITET